jgi:probable rRNA maturation factor
MTIPITFEAESPFSFDAEALLRQVVTAVLDSEDCPYECEVDVLLTDNEAVREINFAERQIDAPTDVLSFPLVDFEAPANFDRLEDDPTLFHPETGELMLGDMVISVDKVLSQAKEYGHSERRELAFLAAHSTFHLLGYDHETDEERLVMEEKQEAVLQDLGITRE